MKTTPNVDYVAVDASEVRSLEAASSEEDKTAVGTPERRESEGVQVPKEAVLSSSK